MVNNFMTTKYSSRSDHHGWQRPLGSSPRHAARRRTSRGSGDRDPHRGGGAEARDRRADAVRVLGRQLAPAGARGPGADAAFDALPRARDAALYREWRSPGSDRPARPAEGVCSGSHRAHGSGDRERRTTASSHRDRLLRARRDRHRHARNASRSPESQTAAVDLLGARWDRRWIC